MMPKYVSLLECPTTDACNAKFPRGGYCSKEKDDHCIQNEELCPRFSDIQEPCSCCPNCRDTGCSSYQGFECVNKTTAQANAKFCFKDDQVLCKGSKEDECACCKQDSPCEDRGCEQWGGYCTKQDRPICSQIDPERCSSKDPNDRCVCCVPPLKPCNQTSRECAKRGRGYSCVSEDEASKWPVPCLHTCHNNGDFHCMCCPPRPTTVTCKDTGCSEQFPGHECRNASVAATWPKKCFENEDQSLCSREPFDFDIHIRADNKFRLFVDADNTIGYGNNWVETYSFSVTASHLIGVEAENWHSAAGIIVSTSDGLVTDSDWKCLDSDLIDSPEAWHHLYDDSHWPNAVSFGLNGVSPWGYSSDISASAEWIWAAKSPKSVLCRKRIGLLLYRGKIILQYLS